MHEINYPLVTTYFIAYTVVNENETIYANGKVDPDQCMTTGLEEMETFTDYELYAQRCAELGLDP